MPLVLSQWAQYAGLNFRCSRLALSRRSRRAPFDFAQGRLRSRPTKFYAVKLCRELFDTLLPFAAIHRYLVWRAVSLTIRFAIVFRRSRSTFVWIWRAVALDPLHFGVHPAGLLHLPHTSVRSQVGLGASLQLAVKSLVVGVQLRDYTFRQDRSGQTLSDHQGIVAQHCEDFAQHSGLFGVTGHPLHLSLELVRCDRPLPVILQRL